MYQSDSERDGCTNQIVKGGVCKIHIELQKGSTVGESSLEESEEDMKGIFKCEVLGPCKYRKTVR